MTSATLFGKLQEYETELARLEKNEIQVKDSKDIALNTRIKNHDSNQEDESTSSEDDDLIKKIEKVLRKERKREAPTRKVIYALNVEKRDMLKVNVLHLKRRRNISREIKIISQRKHI